MAKNEYYKWLVNIIDSCSDLIHMRACHRLIDQYVKRYGNHYERQILTDRLNKVLSELWMHDDEVRSRWGYGRH